jgi:homogentisate 1,2-dioxygenase
VLLIQYEGIIDNAIVSVPQQGVLDVTTEFGKMKVEPNEICVLQVRICFSL